MKVAMTIEKPLYEDHFSPMEEVHSRIELEIDKCEDISIICICFRGEWSL